MHSFKKNTIPLLIIIIVLSALTGCSFNKNNNNDKYEDTAQVTKGYIEKDKFLKEYKAQLKSFEKKYNSNFNMELTTTYSDNYAFESYEITDDNKSKLMELTIGYPINKNDENYNKVVMVDTYTSLDTDNNNQGTIAPLLYMCSIAPYVMAKHIEKYNGTVESYLNSFDEINLEKNFAAYADKGATIIKSGSEASEDNIYFTFDMQTRYMSYGSCYNTSGKTSYEKKEAVDEYVLLYAKNTNIK